MKAGLADMSRLIGSLPRRAAIALLLAIAQSAFLLPIALLVRRVFDHDVAHDHELAVLVDGLLIAACYGASAIASFAGRAYAARVTKQAVAAVRRELVHKLCWLPLSWHDRNSAGDVHAVVIQDCERVDRMVNSLMSQALPAALTGAALAVIGVVLNPVLFVVLLVALPIMLVVARRFAGAFKRKLELWHSTASMFSTHAQLLLRGIATIRAAGAEEHELRRFDSEIAGFVEAGCDSTVAGARFGVIQGAVATVAGVAVLVVGGILVGRHSMSVGALLAFYAVVALLLRQISAVLTATPLILEGVVASRRVKALAASDEPHTYRGSRRIVLRGGIELRNVNFSYRDRRALRDVSLVIEPGEKIALMGANGAGKSTLLALVLGLYRPVRGSISIDGLPLAELDLAALRRQVGVVLQDASLLPGSIYENITMGHPEVSYEAVVTAAKTAEALEFIRELPDGFDTRLSDGGVGLSGGQRQRVAIARAIAARPKLLLLDEPTANLHGAVSASIIRNLRGLDWKPTILIITHDASVAALMERVLEIEDGRLAQQPASAPRLALASRS